jgi:hypothetical protein
VKHEPGQEGAPDDGSTPAPATTYREALSRSTIGARERFEELTDRAVMVRAFATLKARGEYDPARHGDAGEYEPLTTDERLEILAAGEVLARYYRHPSFVDEALSGGATWEQVADASGTSPELARQDYRSWAAGQHHLWTRYEGKFGMTTPSTPPRWTGPRPRPRRPKLPANRRWRQDSEAPDQPGRRGQARAARRRADAPGLRARPARARHSPAGPGEDCGGVAR